jgi:hypothetical protein
MIVHALNMDAKEILCIKVRNVRAKPGFSGKPGYSGKKSGLSELLEHQ